MSVDQMLTEGQFQERLASVKGVRYPLLASGGLTLINAFESERAIVEAARTTSGDVIGKGDKEDRGLIRYLFRHRHSTPVEFPVVKFLVECPMDLWRQWIRHRTASVNEFSSRYSEVPDIQDKTDPGSWRLQAKTNRQGSSGDFVTEYPSEDHRKHAQGDSNYPPPAAGEYLSAEERRLHELAGDIYAERLAFGVAKEQARKDLPLSTYTRAYWQNDLHNTIHFLGLRMDAHAQWEIRQFANKMFEILNLIYPVTMQAFMDYHFNAVSLNALDQQVLIKMMADVRTHGHVDPGPVPLYRPAPPYDVEVFMRSQHPEWVDIKNCRERDECLAKLRKLGFVIA